VNPELAVAVGVDFLRRSARNGGWSAFHLYPGVSDEWVTAYVGATLSEVGVSDFADPALRALSGRQRPDGRFGFNARAVGDADSTLWTLRLAASVNSAASVATHWDRAAALVALAEHVRPDGGVATYAADEPIRTIIEAPPERPMSGWCAVHACVTAVAASVAETAPAAIGYLLAHQRPDGSWPAYWWHDPEYTVAHAAEALAADPHPGSQQAAASAARWALGRLSPLGAILTPAYPQGSPFATALALRAAIAGGGRKAADAAIGWLCRHVRLDGSWEPSAVLRVPHPYDLDPDRPGGTDWVPGGRKEGAVVLDRTAVFTTATVVAALARAALPRNEGSRERLAVG
jgi:squalene-hopene/tetraprenyl-beta-curcumene cyclase